VTKKSQTRANSNSQATPKESQTHKKLSERLSPNPTQVLPLFHNSAQRFSKYKNMLNSNDSTRFIRNPCKKRKAPYSSGQYDALVGHIISGEHKTSTTNPIHKDQIEKAAQTCDTLAQRKGNKRL